MIYYSVTLVMNILRHPCHPCLRVLFMCFIGHSVITRAYDLTVIHNNDFHTHYEAINEKGADCKANQTCFGGIARTVAKVNQLMNEKPKDSVLFLNGGDHFQGTIWYTFQKWKVVAKFVNILRHDAMALGNHEFDDGVEGLIPFIRNVSQNYERNLSIVCSNIEADSQLQQLIRPSIVVERKGKKIAIVGYITPETVFLARPGPTVKFLDEIESIKKEIQNIKQTDPTIDIFIALGHSGFEKDKEIAEKIPELDIVVGGHSNTFLYTGTPPSIEKPEGEYPVVYDHGDEGKTLVVQAYAYGKYLGVLDVQFDEQGIITSYSGNPILLDESVPEDPDTKAQVDEMADQIEEEYKMTVGTSMVHLDQLECRQKECNAGNMFADAYLQYFIDTLRDDLKESWSKVAVALVNGGAVRSGMSAGNVTAKDIISAAPFGSLMGVLKVEGTVLWKVFQHAADQYKLGGFLQVAGVRYQFNSKKPIGQRLEWVRIRCADCSYPVYEELNMTKSYLVAMSDYMANGGDNYTMINATNFDDSAQIKDFDVITQYVYNYSPLMTGVEDRITDSADGDYPCFGSSATTLSYSNSLIVVLIVCLHRLFKSDEKSI